MKTNRRRFLGALGAAGMGALPLPIARWANMTARAADDFPKRFFVFFTPNGVVPEEWFPSGTEEGFSLPAMSKPLDDRRSELIFFRGVHMTSAEIGPGLSHEKGMGHMLTAMPLMPESQGGLAGGISIDQRIANHIGTGTPYRSLELGVRSYSHVVKTITRMSYRGPGQEMPPDSDPQSVFERLYGQPGETPEDKAKRKALRKSVLDYASDELTVLEGKLGTEERRALDGHREGILAMEKRLGFVNDACNPPAFPDKINPQSQSRAPELGKSQMDLAVSALACNMTHVASLQWNTAIGDQVMSWLPGPIAPFPVNGDHHGLSHAASPTNILERPQLRSVQRWYAEQFRYLMDELAKIPEGTGTLLDNTAILWVNELGNGMYHEHTDIPFVLAGGKNLGFRRGRFLQYQDKSHADLYVSIANAYGLDIDTFGHPDACTGELPGLT
ncbi:MAG: DUF1552 domain-containing protein [Myxococcales bacterium]|nr:DUF1552 domain-containing protein [Myxococcales bacterium]